jgi:hypothetical protein
MPSTKNPDSKIETLEDFPQAKRPQKPFLDCGAQGCHIISAKRRGL